MSSQAELKETHDNIVGRLERLRSELRPDMPTEEAIALTQRIEALNDGLAGMYQFAPWLKPGKTDEKAA